MKINFVRITITPWTYAESNHPIELHIEVAIDDNLPINYRKALREDDFKTRFKQIMEEVTQTMEEFVLELQAEGEENLMGGDEKH